MDAVDWLKRRAIGYREPIPVRIIDVQLGH